jgi:hypothetical protein
MFTSKSTNSILALAALLLGSTLAFAHNGMEHVMETVTAMTANSITVDTVKHQSVTVLINPSTKFNNNDAAASQNDLKVGDRVVIHAKDNADKKLVGVVVKWGAGNSAKMGDMKGMKDMGHMK